MCAHLESWKLTFRQSQRDQSDCGLIDQKTAKWLCGCRDAETWCYIHVSRRGKNDQPHAVRRTCRVEAELSDSGTKATSLPNLRIDIPEDNIDVMGRAFVIEVLWFA